MKIPPSIKIGWKALQEAFDALRTAIKERTPRQGAGISINESPTGFLISLQASAPIPPTDGGSSLTADEKALLAFLMNDPGIAGTETPTNPLTPYVPGTPPGPVEWLPWKAGATIGFRKITYLSPVLDVATGYSVNTLYDVWSITGMPFNPRVAEANTFGPPTST